MGPGMREGTIPNRGVAAGARSSSWLTTGILMRHSRTGGGDNQRGAWCRVSEERGLCPRSFSPALWALASDFSLRGQRKVTKRKATPRRFALLRRVTSLQSSDRRHAPTGPPWSLDIPVSRPGLMASPRRIIGGINTVPDCDCDCDWVGSLLLCWPLRGTQNGGCPNLSRRLAERSGANLSVLLCIFV